MKLLIIIIFGLVFWTALESVKEVEKVGARRLNVLVLNDDQAEANLGREKIGKVMELVQMKFMDGSLTTGVCINKVGTDRIDGTFDTIEENTLG